MITPETPTVHRPGVVYRSVLFVSAFVLALLFVGVIGLIFSRKLPAAPGIILSLVLLLPLALTALLTLGFNRIRIELRESDLFVSLSRPGVMFLFPWNIADSAIAWNAVTRVDAIRQFAGTKYETITYVIRSTKGDFSYTWPQFAKAESIASEIRSRSGCLDNAASDSPLNAAAAPQYVAGEGPTAQERIVRGCGWVFTIVSALFLALLILALFGVKEEKRGEIVKAIGITAISFTGAFAMRRYKQIR